MENNTGIDKKVRDAAKVIIDFCRTHETCEECEAWEKGQDCGLLEQILKEARK